MPAGAHGDVPAAGLGCLPAAGWAVISIAGALDGGVDGVGLAHALP